MLINYTFMMKENNHHDLTNRFCLSSFVWSLRISVFSNTYYGPDNGIEMMHQSCITVIIVFRKFRLFLNIYFHSQHLKILVYIYSLVKYERPSQNKHGEAVNCCVVREIPTLSNNLSMPLSPHISFANFLALLPIQCLHFDHTQQFLFDQALQPSSADKRPFLKSA